MYIYPTLIFLLVSGLLCVIGYKKFVYFLSIGYGLAVLGLGIAYLIFSLINNTWDLLGIIWTILLIVYGIRLSGFLIIREIKNANYRKVLKEATKEDEKKMPFVVKTVIWISVTLLYFAETCPVFYRSINATNNLDNLLRFTSTTNYSLIIAPIIGIAISVTGVVLEALADHQKTKEKSINSNMVATHKLYKMVRCPNYFGEIVFWTGVFIGGVQALNTWWQWAIAISGYILIVYVMFNSAQRLDNRQEKRYGELASYREYADHTPLIIPLIPLYHLGKKRSK